MDLLFSYLKLRCYAVIELNVGALEPEFVGELIFYLSAHKGGFARRHIRIQVGGIAGCRLAFGIRSVCHAYMKGLQVLLLDRLGIIPSATKPDNLKIAVQRLFRGANNASGVELRVLPQR